MIKVLITQLLVILYATVHLLIHAGFFVYIYPHINNATNWSMVSSMLNAINIYIQANQSTEIAEYLQYIVYVLYDSQRYSTVLTTVFEAIVLPILIWKILEMFNVYDKIPKITGYDPRKLT